jgi:leucyl-tRNA synthetase
MIFKNLAVKKGKISIQTAQTFAKILSSFAPHIGEELWKIYGADKSLAFESWPDAVEKYLREETFEYPISVNGKLRFTQVFPLDIPENEIKSAIVADERSQKWIEGKEIIKWIIVHNKIVNIVVK